LQQIKLWLQNINLHPLVKRSELRQSYILWQSYETMRFVLAVLKVGIKPYFRSKGRAADMAVVTFVLFLAVS